MHECFYCGQACDCDGEDVWRDAPRSCSHECEFLDDDSWFAGDVPLHACQHPGCVIAEAIGCRVLGGEQDSAPDAWYCSEHASLHGFCNGCGELHAGEEGFETNMYGFCDACEEESQRQDHIDNWSA